MKVSVFPCDNYETGEVEKALRQAIEAIGGLDWVKPNMKIGVKANLVSFMKPESAATTHPSVLCALTKLLRKRGAEVIIGDSPGGLFNSAFVNRVYVATGMREVEKMGAALNDNFESREIEFQAAAVAKRFICTDWLCRVDAIINVCKLKSHGMMSMSAAVKNMFGSIPGTMKPEYHYRYPNEADFADMLVDLNEYFKPCLNIVDAVVGMEGNGPTKGTPRKIGGILVSQNPYALDLTCAKIMGLKLNHVPTLIAAYRRKLAPSSVDDIEIYGDLDALCISDYDNIINHRRLDFSGNGENAFKRLRGKLISSALASRPSLKRKMCVGCKLCANTCPAKAIEMVNRKPRINRRKCIRCFCCQEFCPQGALFVRRPLVARIINPEK